MYSIAYNRCAASYNSATRKNPKKLIIVPPLIIVPLGKLKLYWYEFLTNILYIIKNKPQHMTSFKIANMFILTENKGNKQEKKKENI